MCDLDFLNAEYPVRRTTEEKKAFADYVLSLPSVKRRRGKVEITSDAVNHNIVIGDPASARVVCTAHYDTPAASLFPNLMIPRNLVLFWLYQFLPISLLLGVALGAGFLVSQAFNGDSAVMLLTYFSVYFGLYFLMFRGFKNKHNVNDNTSGVATILGLVAREDIGDDVAFILFDNEEKGKKGSAAFFRDHKEQMAQTLLVNFDCVGNGENIIFIAKKEAETMELYGKLRAGFRSEGAYQVHFFPIRGSESNSDYKNFPCGVGCMACKRSKGGIFYTPNIHTKRDTVASQENIDYIVEQMRAVLASGREKG